MFEIKLIIDNKQKVKNLIVFTICVVFKINTLYSQDFYINKNSEAEYLYNIIPQNWVDLNINESYVFLENSGFTDIKTTFNDNKEIVTGFIPNSNYSYCRRLVFENKTIKRYSDILIFYIPCTSCMVKEWKSKYSIPELQESNEKVYQSALKSDDNLKELFYKYQKESLKKDGMSTELIGDMTDYSFKFKNNKKTDDSSIYRLCQLELVNGIFKFYSEKMVDINNQNYLVGSYNLNTVNLYDLNLMIDIFFLDCKNHNINVKKGKVNASFETLDKLTLGVSYGINDDSRIILKIDPEKWQNASIPKRWYLIYHELGHDVLNLRHGNGGKMMFNFADKGYSWGEFWEDKNYMLETYKHK